jgi:hypothetical protein
VFLKKNYVVASCAGASEESMILCNIYHMDIPRFGVSTKNNPDEN